MTTDKQQIRIDQKVEKKQEDRIAELTELLTKALVVVLKDAQAGSGDSEILQQEIEAALK